MFRVGSTPALLAHLESQALHLACYYEWIPNHLLDFLYIEVLNYFYYKGALESIFIQSGIRDRILTGYALGRLSPVLQRFVREARATGVELPNGFSL